MKAKPTLTLLEESGKTYKEQRKDHTTDIAWNIPFFFVRRWSSVCLFSVSVLVYKFLYTSTLHLFWQHAEELEKRKPAGKVTRAAQTEKRNVFNPERQ
jgi:hypothetical protein